VKQPTVNGRFRPCPLSINTMGFVIGRMAQALGLGRWRMKCRRTGSLMKAKPPTGFLATIGRFAVDAAGFVCGMQAEFMKCGPCQE